MALTRRKEASPDEFKAMAHPLRLRILRLCLHDSLTNKQIADRLGKDPATVLHHVRMLVDTGFLEGEAPRSGVRGALEKPYRATGKSWRLSVERFPADRRLQGLLAVIDAYRAEVAEAGADHGVASARLGLKLNQTSMEELSERMMAIVQEFADRPEDPDGEACGLYLGIHKRADRP
jgi:predicted ArsR family transcriptional regulator